MAGGKIDGKIVLMFWGRDRLSGRLVYKGKESVAHSGDWAVYAAFIEVPKPK